MRLAPLDELLVAREHGVDHLVQHVLGRLAQELRVRVQRLVVLAIESRAVLHELLAARARLDQWHGALRFRKMCATVGDRLEALCATSGRPAAGPAPCRVDDACAGHVRPDERDTQPGRERPPRDRARDRVRGVAEGVAHAPAASPLSSRPRRRSHARHKTPRDLGVSNSLAFNNMRTRLRLDRHLRSSQPLRDLAQRTRRGNAPPDVCVPPSVRARSASYAEPTRGARCGIDMRQHLRSSRGPCRRAIASSSTGDTVACTGASPFFFQSR